MAIHYKATTKDDVQTLMDIYNYYVVNTTVSFQKKEADRKGMEAILFYDDIRYQAFTIRDDHEIMGYCILEKYHPREAYNITSEIAIYLKPEASAKGIGGQAIAFLEKEAIDRGFMSLLAVICYENKPSIRLFEKLGYNKVAHYEKVGEKFGRLLDVVTYQKILS